MKGKKRRERIVVKGYMRPDGTSYYVVIPKPIRELLNLKGGEYFVMKVDEDDREIELKLVDFAEDKPKTEASPITQVITASKKQHVELDAEERTEE